MSVGRTHGSTLVIGEKTGGVLVQPNNWVGLTIPGVATVVNEPFQDRTLAEASVLQAGQSVGFSIVYDTPTFDTELDSLLGSGNYVTDTDPDRWMALICSSPDSWQAMPVDLQRPGRNASTTSSIVRPWNLSATGRGCHGTSWAAFGPTTAGTAYDTGVMSLDGGTITDAVIGIVITVAPASVTNISISAGAHSYTIEDDIGIDIRDDDVGAAEVRITSTGGAISGFVLVGRRDPVPSG